MWRWERGSPATELSAVHTSAVQGSLAGEAVSLKFSISQVGESKCTSNVFVQRSELGTAGSAQRAISARHRDLNLRDPPLHTSRDTSCELCPL